jgi:hypothetical protein
MSAEGGPGRSSGLNRFGYGISGGLLLDTGIGR